MHVIRAFFLPPSLAFAGTTDPRTAHTAAWSLPGGTSMVNSARAHRPICKRVGRGSSSYVHFERLLSPAQVERARRFAASPPVQQALSDAELFDGPGGMPQRARTPRRQGPKSCSPTHKSSLALDSVTRPAVAGGVARPCRTRERQVARSQWQVR